MATTPFVSIITPVYNGAKFIEELIISIQNQDYQNYEHIVIDDGSDDHEDIQMILQKYPKLKWWKRENRGQYYSMNEGLHSASGDIVCFISADDYMADHAISNVINHFSINTDIEAVYGLTGYLDNQTRKIKYQKFLGLVPPRLYPYFPYQFQFQHCSFFVKKKCVIEKDIFFDPKLRFVGDYEWIIRVINSGVRIAFINKVLSIVRFHDTQISHLNKDDMELEKLDVIKRHRLIFLEKIYLLKMWFSKNLR